MSQELPQSNLNSVRNDKFRLIANPPAMMKDLLVKLQQRSDKDTANFDSFRFSIRNIPIPVIEGTYETLHYAGHNLNVSTISSPNYPELVIEFKIDNNWLNWWFIFKWINMIQDKKTGLPDSDEQYQPDEAFLPQDYLSNFSVYALDEYNKDVMRFDYRYCVPVKLEPGTSSDFVYDQDHVELTAKVTFKYAQVVPVPSFSENY